MKKKLKIISFSTILLISTSMVAQSSHSIASSGSASSNYGKVDYSIGQTFYVPTKNELKSVSPGVQQSFEIIETTNYVDNTNSILLVSGKLSLEILQTAKTPYTGDVIISDFQGRELSKMTLQPERTPLEIEHYASGFFLITIVSENKIIKSFKIKN